MLDRSPAQTGKGKDQKGRAAPSIALPKGGGALHAIDEKFSVNPVNGTVDLHLPLPFSESRAGGLNGALSLQYSSGGGAGPFGLGWSLSLPTIQRRTDKQLPLYADADESDTFLIAGAEDLVPSFTQQPDGSWTRDREVIGAYTVERYRPRIEGTFSRIEKIAVAGEAAPFWRVTSRENVCTLYGRGEAARLADPKDPSRVYRWLPQWSFDARGNCVEYEYKAEDLVGVPNDVSEKNRRSGVAPFANRYLKAVRYGNHAPYYPDPAAPYDPAPPNAPGYFFQAVFDYGEHDPDAPTPDDAGDWPCRRDPFSDCRPGFDLRSYRLCRRILFFHSFAELDPAPCLVRSVDLAYAHFQFQPTLAYDQEADFIVSITSAHYRKAGAATYAKQTLPPFECSYQPLAWDRTVRTIAAEDTIGAPAGVADGYQWTDLYAEGLQGILTEQADGWFYKQNLGEGRLGSAARVASKPSYAGVAAGTLQFQDLNADGSRQLVVGSRPRGFFALGDDNSWSPFRPFANDVTVDLADPNVKFLDLNGDGRPDILISEELLLRWHPSLGVDGYDPAQVQAKAWDEDQGPAVIFADGTETIFTADMNGDGLSEIVRVRNHDVCYWPNLGYGRFGPKVTMANPPYFDTPDHFDPRRIQFADVSGTGAADILYLGRGGMSAWINLAGNAWSVAQTIDPFPGTERPNKVSVIDLLGVGTPSIVWSSELPANGAAPLRYVDLMGGKKPYIMSGYVNNFGKAVTLEYMSSSHYFLLDRAEGRPWATKLPFPTMCLSRVETREAVTGALFVQRYRYRHGYYDHSEREFRGFGMVEMYDAESFDRYAQTGPDTLADQPVVEPPVRTRTWRHVGAYLGGETILHQFAADYYVNTALPEPRLPDAVIEAPPGYAPTPEELREAARACKGMMLREEVYADDGSPLAATPYSATESNGHIRMLQPRLGNRYAVFLPHASETVTYHYERNPADPRITHELNTLIDELGEVLEQASIAYGRAAPDASLPASVQQAQGQLRATYQTHLYTNDVDTPGAYRRRAGCERQTFELTGFTPAGARAGVDEVRNAFAGAAALGYEQAPVPGVLHKRILKHHRTLYVSDADVNDPAPFKTLGVLGFCYQCYDLVLTPGLLVSLYGGRVTDAMLAEGRHTRGDDLVASGLFPASDLPGNWWKGEGVIVYPPQPDQHFYLPQTYLDPYGNPTSLTYYSDYHLMMSGVTDATGAETTVEAFDFRVLQPRSITDINDNILQASFDILGRVTGVALLGKGAEADDLTGFQPDLSQAAIDAFLADPLGQGPALLQNATSRFIYDHSQTPAVSAMIQRETHAAVAAAEGAPSRLRYQFEYSDGLGQVAMTKGEAEPGKALQCVVAADGTFTVTTIDTGASPRWIGSGRTVHNNKGDPVMKYEPYFSVTPAYENAPELVETGVTPILSYDPLGRTVRTDFPDGAFARVAFNPWSDLHFDQNDTVLASDWYAARIGGALGPAAQAAAQRTVLHDSTPEASHFDALGRTVYAVSDNKWLDPATNTPVEAFYAVDHDLDIEGQQLAVRDARGNTVQRQAYDMAGVAAASSTMDVGARWLLNDAMGKAHYGWDAKGNRFHSVYDVLNRPLQHEVLTPAAATIVFDKSVYGSDKTKNQNGKLILQYDASGTVAHNLYDFKGNTLSSTRTFTEAHSGDIDWSDPAAIGMQPTGYTSLASYDALNRATSATSPDGSVTVHTYSLANLLTGVDVAIGGAASTAFVTDIAHDAKGQRLKIDYACGASTAYVYDPLTFRVARMTTTRAADGAILQDLAYTYDPVGNITTLADAAQQTVYFAGAVVRPQADFTYDAVYWLRSATGRELIGLNGAVSQFDADRSGQAHPADGTALRRYLQRYDYDPAGNMASMAHASGAGPFLTQWTRIFAPEATTNRLASSQVGATLEAYSYDVQGNLTAMPGLVSLDWDFENRFRGADLGGGGAAAYTYDAEGQRARKVVERLGDVVEERLYIGVIEVFTRTRKGAVELQRQTLHVMDGGHRLAMVETRTAGDDGLAPQILRYQFSNHIGTALLELDAAAQIISYEEYYPFGSTCFQSVNAGLEAPNKRYRYTGKERDEETGLSYHGARYYAPWLARWTAADPAGIGDGLNRYLYSGNHPIGSHDPTGMWEVNWRTVAIVTAVVVVGVAVTVATAGLAGPIATSVAAATAGTLGATGSVIAGGAAAGAVVGGLAGAASGAAGELTRQTVNSRALGLGNQEFSARAVLRETGKGLVTGAVGGAVTGGVAAGLLRAANATSVGARLAATTRVAGTGRALGTQAARLGRNVAVGAAAGGSGAAAGETTRELISGEHLSGRRILTAGAIGVGIGAAVPLVRGAYGALARGTVKSQSVDPAMVTAANATRTGGTVPRGTQLHATHGAPGLIEMPGSPSGVPVGQLAPEIAANPARNVTIFACKVACDEPALRSLAEGTGRNVTAYTDSPLIRSPLTSPVVRSGAAASPLSFFPDTHSAVQAGNAAATAGGAATGVRVLEYVF